MPRPFESFWDRAYRDGSYLDHWEAPEVPAELAALVATGPAAGVVPEAGTVLDVGCGAGLEAVWLARRGFRVIGVDSSPGALERARERSAEAGVGVDWRLGSAYRLPVDDGSIALALDRGCLHGIDREDRPDYAAEIERVLAPGGMLFLRGAQEDDDEQGLVGIGEEELDRLFPRFAREPLVPIVLRAPAGDLAGHLAVLRKRRKPGKPTG